MPSPLLSCAGMIRVVLVADIEKVVGERGGREEEKFDMCQRTSDRSRGRAGRRGGGGGD